MAKKKAVIFDLDGTLAEIEHRVPYVRQGPPDWKNFCERIPDDVLNDWCFELAGAMADRGYKIIIVTGRGERYNDLTREWLQKHNVVYDHIFSRKSKDRRNDSEVKKEIYERDIKDHFDVLFVVDDRASVVKMWRDELHLVTLQCDWGNF